MNFSEAMQKLESGSKVTRTPLHGVVYFKKDGDSIKSYQSKITPYHYNEDIMISSGWKVEGQEGEFKFYDIIPFLMQGLKAYLKEWAEGFIFYDNSTKDLSYWSMDSFQFIPEFESFIAQDWMEI